MQSSHSWGLSRFLSHPTHSQPSELGTQPRGQPQDLTHLREHEQKGMRMLSGVCNSKGSSAGENKMNGGGCERVLETECHAAFGFAQGRAFAETVLKCIPRLLDELTRPIGLEKLSTPQEGNGLENQDISTGRFPGRVAMDRILDHQNRHAQPLGGRRRPLSHCAGRRVLNSSS